ncbi:MAG: hypothetical protein ACRCZW_13245 [Lactobacillaceae bacterium]
MFKVTFLKIKHQLLLLAVMLLVVLYGLYFSFKIRDTPVNGDLWFKNCLVYLNCLAPFFISLIIAIQKKFEDQKPNFNSVLSRPSRTKWLLNFILGTYIIWLMNVLIISLLFLIFNNLPYKEYINLWVSLALLGLIWIPVIEYFGIIHGYLASIAVGIMAIPFMIYYGTTTLGTGLWRFIPWIYGTRIYLVSEPQLIWMIITTLVLTLGEQLLINWRFNNWGGN